MRSILLFAFALMLSTPADAQEGYWGSRRKTVIDPQSGNIYTVKKRYNWSDRGEETEIQGFNPSNGSRWEQTIEADGDMQGVDARGNRWQYKDFIGQYNNFGTGEYCFGKGYGRYCNQ